MMETPHSLARAESLIGSNMRSASYPLKVHLMQALKMRAQVTKKTMEGLWHTWIENQYSRAKRGSRLTRMKKRSALSIKPCISFWEDLQSLRAKSLNLKKLCFPKAQVQLIQ